MQLYTGTKQVKAKPMNRADYNTLRGWQLPADEDGTDEGYLVEYVDGGKANVEGYAGYISWSPKGVFEMSYNPCGTYIQRLHIEYYDLQEKVVKLQAFLNTESYDKLEELQRLYLLGQLASMKAYLNYLHLRTM